MVGMFLVAAMLAMADQDASVGLPLGRNSGGPFGAGPGMIDNACLLKGVRVGQPVPEATRRMAQDDPQRFRILRPGDAATMDFIPGRTNLIVDAQERLLHVRCG